MIGALLHARRRRAFGDAVPRHRRSPFDDGARRAADREQPRWPSSSSLEREVTLGDATAYDLHLRLLPHLREIAQCRLERAGRDAGPGDARPLVGAAAPRPRAAGDRFAAGLPQRELRALVADLERM